MNGQFSWSYGAHFHIKLEDGRNFEWSDPEYLGDDSVIPAPSLKQWIKDKRIPYSRCKGNHDVDAFTNNAFRRAGITQ